MASRALVWFRRDLRLGDNPAWASATERDEVAAERRLGMPTERHWGTLVHPPATVLTKAGSLSKVFTPFHRSWSARLLPPEARSGSARIVGAAAGSTLERALARTGDDQPAPWGEQDALDQS